MCHGSVSLARPELVSMCTRLRPSSRDFFRKRRSPGSELTTTFKLQPC
jgi:hypothetical protein